MPSTAGRASGNAALSLGPLDAALRPPKTTAMKETTKRSILRWIHIVFALPLIGYIYGPPAETVQYLPYFRWIYFPAVALSGLWMWKGPAVRRLLARSGGK